MIKNIWFSAYYKKGKLFDYLCSTGLGREADFELEKNQEEIGKVIVSEKLSKMKLKKTKLYFVMFSCDWLEGKKVIKNLQDFEVIEIEPLVGEDLKRYKKNLREENEEKSD